ncbi:ATP-dependent DNA helicase [Yamadazyma tenuis ATCC 10573]|uniref:DNA 3'-5' helicase n=1 Tax=Candida tenuis (strain ATCC 10573 / BCRC 21748 / CBS 615 / JCM 9827 / NBRC 10315 / NRRL Y-1498 / VKM Y-70) TaxID=590646 RepID=G3B3U1_CANTC|nr:ATP-dependent DNA helicase [Yamadazyma tenuis ATCC 10573]EGV63732.1 ATP-dependent DNA helicase [Yamadazyma tenuis ATCC 10573]
MYQKYINYLEIKCSLLSQRYSIFESSSISLDEKNRFIREEFTPKFAKIESSLDSIKNLLPRFALKDLSQISDVGEVEITSSVQVPGTLSEIPEVQVQNSTANVSEDDFSELEVTQVNLTKPSRLPNDGLISLSSEPDVFVAAPSSPPRTPLRSEDDVEDEFGQHEMDGLMTPTHEIDDADTDLSGFVVDDVDVEDTEDISEFGSDAESIAETQFHIDQDELNDLRLSQDVADNFGINYEEMDNDLELDNDFITTQLNDERELNYEVIEISDDEEGVSDLGGHTTFVKPEKTSQKARKPAYDEFDEFDDEFADDVVEMGITTSIDIIREQQNRYPGCEPYIKEIYSVLNKKFKLQNFRSNQFEAIISLLQGRDVFVLMPTGGGKSLCYQLPSLIKIGARNQGVTIVISPLISLMQDQVQHLKNKNIKAGMINSKIEYSEKKQIIDLFKTAQLDLVYLSPEMVNSSAQIQRIIKQLYDTKQLNKVIVDEAHCISSWGHDFRPDYKAMSIFRQNYPDIPIMALTATANDKVRLDILHLLNMKSPKVFKQSFNRINLYYEIRMKKAGFVEDIRDTILAKYKNQTGIIYCHSKQSCEQISMKLNQFGIESAFYHAGMSTEDRFEVQDSWQQERLRVICATIAFGMGIDKPNVRFVIHSFLPRNLEGYYQETGRAGRDGLHSDCIMYYSYKDARNLQLMIQKDEEYNQATKDNHLSKLRQVIQYCENNHDCRRRQVLQYFNENFDPKDCQKQCDSCNNNGSEISRDFTDVSRSIIRLVQSIQNEKITLLYCQDIFKGSNNSKIVSKGHHQLEYHGMGSKLTKLEIERIFFHLICEGCLEEYSVIKGGFASNYVRVGLQASQVLSGTKSIVIKFSNIIPETKATPVSGFVSAKTNKPIKLPQNNLSSFVNASNRMHIDRCFHELNLIRNQRKIELNFQNANSILSDDSLKKLAIMLPTSKQEFKKYVNNNDQLNYFIYFKSKLMELSRERKEKSGQKVGRNLKTNGTHSGGSQRHRGSKYFKRPGAAKKKRSQKTMPE